jgi:hypothetical protein
MASLLVKYVTKLCDRRFPRLSGFTPRSIVSSGGWLSELRKGTFPPHSWERRQVSPKRCFPSTRIHGVRIYKNTVCIQNYKHIFRNNFRSTDFVLSAYSFRERSPPGGTLSRLTRVVDLLHVKEPHVPKRSHWAKLVSIFTVQRSWPCHRQRGYFRCSLVGGTSGLVRCVRMAAVWISIEDVQ